ncbi:MAG: hypothetical protein M3Q42_11835 [Pseudomonadota bacterium]|nr:hypothetical protein [Pseudomonadota bacterium]
MSASQLETLYSEAVAALDAGDYDTAITKAMAVKVRLATMPNVERSLGGGGKQRTEWANAASLNTFILECRRLKGASLGLQQSKITYARPSLSEDY